MIKRLYKETDCEYIERLIESVSLYSLKEYIIQDCLKSLYTIKDLGRVSAAIRALETGKIEDIEYFENAICFPSVAAYYSVAMLNSFWSKWITQSSYWSMFAYVQKVKESIDWKEIRKKKTRQLLLYIKKLVYKPVFPRNFINYLLNSSSSEELNVWIIDYAQEKSLPDVREYVSFLYEKEYDPTLIIGNKELEHLLN